MKKSKFEKIMEKSSFDDAMALLYEESDTVTTYEALKCFVIQNIEGDNNMLALHIWNAVYNNGSVSDWFYYDYCLGTMCTPQQLNNIEDVEQYIGFDKED